MAIYREEDQAKFVEACGVREFVPCWLMLQGCHTHDVVYREKFHIDGMWLSYARCKTGTIRKIPLPPEIGPKLDYWLRYGRRCSADGFHKMVVRVGKRAGLGSSITPMSLRHTYALNMLRKYRHRADAIDLVAMGMGCSRQVAMRHYLEYTQMEALDPAVTPTLVETKAVSSTGSATVAPKSNTVHTPKSVGLIPANMLVLMAKKTAQ